MVGRRGTSQVGRGKLPVWRCSNYEAYLRLIVWRPETPLEQVIAEYIEWVKAQPHLRDFYAETEQKMRAANIIRRAQS